MCAFECLFVEWFQQVKMSREKNKKSFKAHIKKLVTQNLQPTLNRQEVNKMSSPSERLEKIKNNMKNLLETAQQIIGSTLDRDALEQANNSWFISIRSALDGDHEYLELSSVTTMQDTITRLWENEEQAKQDSEDKSDW